MRTAEQKLSSFKGRSSEPALNNSVGLDPFDEDKFSVCVHCGMCLESCPTYQELGHEHQSPRGRVHLISKAAKGEIDINEAFEDPVFTCLDCRACETGCPAGVQVGALIEEARGQVRNEMPLSGWSGWVSRFFLRGIFPRPTRMHFLGKMARLYQKSGLQTAVRKTGLKKVLPDHLADMEAVMPTVHQPVLKTHPAQVAAQGETKNKVAFFTGCIMDVMFADVNEATIRNLTRNGNEVVLPQEQRCCGALQVHAGDREQGKELARHNIDTFLAEDVDKIVINSAGCGCALKEYPELLQNDSEYVHKAEEFSSKVEDVSYYLYQTGYEKPQGEVNTRITYHDACHLAHGQGVWDEPRALLEDIPGVKLEPLPDADRCCGSAGIYNITNPEMAGRLLDRKMDDIPENVEMISMGNPGCMLQIAMGVMQHGRSEKVVHTMQVLDWAYEKEKGNSEEERDPSLSRGQQSESAQEQAAATKEGVQHGSHK